MTKTADIKKPEAESCGIGIILLVWVARIAIGGLFIASGISKAIDIWGVTYKISDYLAAWQWDIPRSLVVTASYLLAVWEGVLGAMLLLGCYRRCSVWLLLATMAFMLPLTVYIYIFEPVADCGCFGDMIVISNAATLWKNVIIVGALIFLAFYNKRVVGLISPYLQWVGGFFILLYFCLVSLQGYNVQPLFDFRAFPEGTRLAQTDDDEEEASDVTFEFIYEKDGEQRIFSTANLPDSTWTFVDRKVVGESNTNSADDFVVYDQGEDVTAEAISTEGEQLLVLIPDLQRVDISFTSYLNRLNRQLESRGGSMAGIIATDDRGLEFWRDISLAEYPLYTADPAQIKSLARGHMALVYLRDGVIVWKRVASSIDGEKLIRLSENDKLSDLRLNNSRIFWSETWTLAVILFFIIFADGIRRIVSMLLRRNRQNATLNIKH